MVLGFLDLARWARLFERMARRGPKCIEHGPMGRRPKRIKRGPTGRDSDLNTSHAALELRLQGMAVTTLSLDVTHIDLVHSTISPLGKYERPSQIHPD